MPKRTLAKTEGRSGKKRPSNRDVEVLATLLVAYPQVSRVTFDPENKALGLVFLCQGPIGARRRSEISQLYSDAVQVFLRLTRRRATVVKTLWEKMGDFYCFQVERDVASISSEELNLTADLISEKAKLVVSQEEVEMSDGREDFAWSARLFLQEMLEQVKDLRSKRKLVALREGEKVLVFDK
ncbi:MAG: hypothetical protein ACM3WU_01015 [Bacillota bacterium]